MSPSPPFAIKPLERADCRRPEEPTTIYTMTPALFEGLSLAIGDGDMKVGVFVVAFLIISLGVHEAAHAWVAHLCGDSTARDMGRLTLNPLPHIDPVMTILLPGFLILSGSGFIFGGAKPVPVVYENLRKPARDMMLVALAGPISNVLIAFVLLLVLKVAVYTGGMSMTQLAPQVLVMSVQFNLLLAVFNMIPVPPLDGSRVLAYLLPIKLRASFQALDRFSMLLIFVLLFSGTLRRPILLGIEFLFGLLDGFTGGVWA